MEVKQRHRREEEERGRERKLMAAEDVLLLPLHFIIMQTQVIHPHAVRLINDGVKLVLSWVWRIKSSGMEIFFWMEISAFFSTSEVDDSQCES